MALASLIKRRLPAETINIRLCIFFNPIQTDPYSVLAGDLAPKCNEIQQRPDVNSQSMKRAIGICRYRAMVSAVIGCWYVAVLRHSANCYRQIGRPVPGSP